MLLRGQVESYFGWKQFMKNRQRLKENHGGAITAVASQAWPGTLEGITLCETCGRKMTVAHDGHDGKYYHYQSRVAYRGRHAGVMVVTARPSTHPQEPSTAEPGYAPRRPRIKPLRLGRASREFAGIGSPSTPRVDRVRRVVVATKSIFRQKQINAWAQQNDHCF